MAIQWPGDRAYEVPMNAEPAGGVPPRTLPVPSTSDVAYVNGLADAFDDGWVLHDSPDAAEWAIIAAVGVVGIGIVVALGAACIIGAVTIARWLGWA